MAFKLLRDTYTGPDGKYWAIGRIYSAPVLLLGLGYPVYQTLAHHKDYSLHEMGMYLGEVGLAIWIFIRGHNRIDEETPVATPRPVA